MCSALGSKPSTTKTKQLRAGDVAGCSGTCLTCDRPWVQWIILQANKQKRHKPVVIKIVWTGIQTYRSTEIEFRQFEKAKMDSHMQKKAVMHLPHMKTENESKT
jgi:hypothetical protein